MEVVLTDDFIPFGSRQSLFKEIIETLRDENVTTIGIWGMAGIGKTTLATEVGKRAKDERLSDQVVKAVASQDPNIRIIQGTLADLLGLQLEGASEADRATELSAGIKKCGRILIILDDIWNKLNLADIGIPSGLDHKGCKILITTRLAQVCDDMCYQRKFTLNVLDDNEAWVLFSKHARLSQNSELRGKAREVVKKCRGLPLAIETVGSALRNKSLEDYKDAIWRLSHANFVNIESVDREIYPIIELSINYLKCEETEELLFLCSLYPEDSKIPSEDLTRITFGLELFKNVNSVEEARQTTLRRVRKLLDACLLLPRKKDWSPLGTYGGNVREAYVKVHDIVRDVALWLSRKRNNSYLTTHSVKHHRKRYEAATAISIKNRELDWPLPDRLKYPQLKLLLLETDGLFSELKDDCFEMMRNLQVLVLSSSGYYRPKADYTLPVSIEHLRNLRTFHLYDERRFYLGAEHGRWCGANIIGKLKSLQILSLGGQCTEKLPQEIEELTNLRLLDLSRCRPLKKIPRNVLSSLTALEELYIHDGLMVEKDLLSEITSLPHLTAFTARMNWVGVLPTLSFRKPLQRFQINSTGFCDPFLRTVEVDFLDCSRIASLQQLFPRVENLRIGRLQDTLENLLPECFDDLTRLQIDACDLDCLIDTTKTCQPMPLFSNLQLLILGKATRMTRLCKGPPPPGCFTNLRVADISRNDGCRNIVPHVIPIGPKLKSLSIWGCEGLQYIFEFDLQDDLKNKMPLLPSPLGMDLWDLPELRGIWKPPHCWETLQLANNDNRHGCLNLALEAQLRNLNSVDTITMTGCEKVEEAFQLIDYDDQIYKKQFSNLRVISFKNLTALRCIWKGPHQNLHLHKLECIELNNCQKLTSIFTATSARNLHKLRSIKMSKCEALEAIIALNKDEFSTTVDSSPTVANISELEKIEISLCGELKSILPVSVVVAQGLPKLRHFSIINCAKLEHVFGGGEGTLTAADSSPTVASIPELEKIKILSCGELKSIFPVSVVVAQGLPKLRHFSIINLAKLEKIEISSCGELKSILPVSVVAQGLPKLTRFSIIDCAKLGEVFGGEKGTLTSSDEITMNNLRSLVLIRLPNLTCFSTACQHLICPSLQDLSVEACPLIGKRLDLFHRKEQKSEIVATATLQSWASLERLELVEVDEMDELFDLSGMCIGPMHRPFCSSLITLHLLSLTAVNHIWKGPIHSVQLHYLRHLHVVRCPNLRTLLTPVIADALPQLKSIGIAYCQNLETIIAMGDHEAQATGGLNFSEHALFPKLEQICIRECKQMKRVFAFSVAQELPRLRNLRIENCPVLEQVFSVDEREQSEDAKLKEIKLPSSPSLTLTIDNVRRFTLLTSSNLPVSCPRLTQLFLEGKDATETALGFADIIMLPEGPQDYLQTCRKFGDTPLRFGAVSNHFGVDKLVVIYSEVEELFDLELMVGGSNQEAVSIEITILLCLSNLPDLKCIWKGPTNLISWIHIRSIEVGNCARLKNSLFTYSIAQKLSGLTILYVYNCKELEYIIGPKDYSLEDEEESCSSSDQCLSWLRKIKVEGCESLKFIVPLSVAQRLPTLEEITIRRARRLEKVIGDDIKNKCATDKEILLPKLRMLKLQDLTCLRRMVPAGYSFSRSSVAELQEVSIKNCNIEELFDLKVETENSSNEGHEQGNQSSSSSSTCLPNLQKIEVEECPNLKALFNSTTSGPLTKLNSILIKNCQNLKTILPMDEGHSVNDYDLGEPLLWRIYGCYNLKTIDLSGAQELPQLTYLTIIDCPVLQQVFYSDEGKHREFRKHEIQLPSLSVLKIIRVPRSMRFTSTGHRIICPCLKEVVIEVIEASDMDDLSQRFAGMTLMEPQEKLEMRNCYKFGDVMPWLPALQSSTNLQVLKIDNCEIQEVFDLEQMVGESNLQPVLTELKHLCLSGLHDLDCIWKCLGSFVNLTNLYNIELRDCVNLKKSLFTYNIAQKLYVLQVLHIHNCKELEYIIEPRDVNLEEEQEICFVTACLADLKKVRVEGCENLKFLFPVSAAQILPSLEEMIIRRAGQLEQVIGSDQRKAKNKEIVLPKLRVLELEDLPCLSRISPEGYSLRRSSIAKLRRVLIKNCNIEDGFDLKNELIRLSPEPEVLNLEELYLCNLPNLKYMWKGYIDPCHLQRIVVRNCLALEYIFEPGDQSDEHERGNDFSCSSASVGLQKLSKIEVEECEGLKSIFLLSSAQELPSIKQISIKRARRLEQLFTEDRTSAKRKEILLPELRILELEDLPCLSHILPAGYTVSRLSFPKLQAVFIKNCSIEEVFDCTLNHMKIYLGPVFANLTVAYLCCLPKLMHIWKAAYPGASMGFNKLKSIYVEGCDGLKTIFPEDQYFPALETVHVVGAPTSWMSSNPPVPLRLMFPQLRTVKVDPLPSQAAPSRQSAFDSYVEMARNDILFDLEDQVEVDVCAAFQAYKDVMERESVNSHRPHVPSVKRRRYQ